MNQPPHMQELTNQLLEVEKLIDQIKELIIRIEQLRQQIAISIARNKFYFHGNSRNTPAKISNI